MYRSPKVAMHTETIEQAVSTIVDPFSTYAATDISIITHWKDLVYRKIQIGYDLWLK